MSTLGKAVIEFSADTARFQADVGRAAVVFDKSMASMARGLADLRNMAVAAAGAGGIVALVKGSIDTAEQLDKLSQRTALSVERLSELRFAAALSGVGMEEFAAAMRTFNVQVVEASDQNSKAAGIFRALGVDISQGAAPALEKFMAIVAAMPAGEQKVAVLREAFGKTGEALIPMVNGLEDASEKARKLGLVISGDVGKQASEFNDNLKLLAERTTAFGIALTGKLIGGLNEMSKGLAEAAINGNLLGQSLLEVAKIWSVLLAQLPGFHPLSGVGDKMAEFLFQEEEKRRMFKSGPNMWPGAQKPAEAATAPQNQDELACVLSGGKWVGGQCQRGGAKGGKSDAERLRELDQKGWIEHAETVIREAEEEDRALAKISEEYWANEEKKREQDTRGWVEHAEAVLREAEEQDRALAEIASRTKDTTGWARDLGLTFTSAFEAAIVGGKGLMEVLKGIGKDLLALATRKLITEPIGKSITDAIGGGGGFGGLAALFQGGGGGEAAALMAGVAPLATGTDYVPHDGLAYLHKGEAIVPASENGRGGPQVFIDARGADAAALARLERTVERMDGSFERRAIAANVDAARRGLRA